MYFTECAHLAEKHPDLAEAIKDVDAKFREMGTAEVIRPDDFASFLGIDLNQIKSILEMLARERLLREEKMIECLHCSMAVLHSDYQDAIDEEDEYSCTSCDRLLSMNTAKTINTYRRGEKWKEEPLTATLSEKTPDQIEALDEQAWYTHDRLAEHFGVGKDALRKRLDRYRKGNLDGWKENEDRRPREAKFLYQLKYIVDIVEKMALSSQRPAK